MAAVMLAATIPATAAGPSVMQRITIEIPVDSSDASAPNLYITLTDVYDRYHWGNINESYPHITDSMIFDMSKSSTISFNQDTILMWRTEGHIDHLIQVKAGEIIRLTGELFAYQWSILFSVTSGFSPVGDSEYLQNIAYFRFYGEQNNHPSGVTVKGTGDISTLAVGYTPPLTVSPTPSTVYINGTATLFEAYLIRGNNYFKLRDLAQALSGYSKQFEVTYDNATRIISMTSDRPYTRIGGEMVPGDGRAKQAVFNAGILVDKDGVPVHIKAYLINGNNFVMLRDIMSLFDISVVYDTATRNITIDTSRPYSD